MQNMKNARNQLKTRPDNQKSRPAIPRLRRGATRAGL